MKRYTIVALKMERVDTCMRGVDPIVLPFHRLVEKKDTIRLIYITIIIHFVILQNTATTLHLRVIFYTLTFLVHKCHPLCLHI